MIQTSNAPADVVLPVDGRRAIIKSPLRRIVYAPVYSPMKVDTQNDMTVARVIEKFAHDFLARGLTDRIDVMHDQVKSGCVIVESFVARKGDPDFMEGEWVLGVKITRDDLWERIQRGELNGFSFGGWLSSYPFIVELDRPVHGNGDTEKSSGPYPEHTHSLELDFLDAGGIVPTTTGETLGHIHAVLGTTATETAYDHGHRLILGAGDGN